jgi:tRNA pseudouridine38-40 synthase
MARWALKVEYDGTNYVGWQQQADGPSIQSVLQDALARLEGAAVACIAAGRTDSGVHAEAQVVHADLARMLPPRRLLTALNYHLKPHPIVVVAACRVAEDFNARFSAIGRAYRYRILNRAARPGLLANRVWHVPRPLDAAAMHAGAQHLLGRHDFSSFRAAACQASSPLRTLDRLDVRRHGEMIEIFAEARSFLHHQVRNMVGTLKRVGEGRWAPAHMADVLAARDRSAAGQTAPAAGLCLTSVMYPQDPFDGAEEEEQDLLFQ